MNIYEQHCWTKKQVKLTSPSYEMGTDIKLGPGVLWEIDLPTSISMKVKIEDVKNLEKTSASLFT